MMGNRLPLVRMGWRVIPLLVHLEADEVAQILGLSQVNKYNYGMYKNNLFVNLIHDQQWGYLMWKYRTVQCLKHVKAFGQASRERLTDLLARICRAAQGDFTPLIVTFFFHKITCPFLEIDFYLEVCLYDTVFTCSTLYRGAYLRLARTYFQRDVLQVRPLWNDSQRDPILRNLSLILNILSVCCYRPCYLPFFSIPFLGYFKEN